MQRIIVIALAILVALPVVMKSREKGLKPVPAAFSVISGSGSVVRISGDVRHPGLYKISANTLTNTVIKMAIPTRPITRFIPSESDIRPLFKGDHLQLSILEDSSAVIKLGILTASERMVLGIPLDINAMSAADFDLLPGIGPSLAQRIIEYRQKNGGKMVVENLREVEGIGEKKYLAIRDYF